MGNRAKLATRFFCTSYFMTKFCLITLLMLLFSNANAKLYQYTDADGNVYFTDTPPIDANVQERAFKGGKPNTDSVEKLHAERAATVKAKEEAAKAAVVSEQEAKNKEIRAKNCEIAKKRLQFYDDNAGRRIRTVNADGEYIYSTPKEITADTNEAKALVEEWCNPPKPKTAPQP